MKYRAGNKKNDDIVMKIDNILLSSENKLFRYIERAVKPIVPDINKNPLGSLLLKLLSLKTKPSKLIFEHFFTSTIVLIKEIQNNIGLSITNANASPELIKNQNITFQKLSLFSLSLIQFIQLTAFNLYRSILPLISAKLKINRALLVVIIAMSSANVSNAAELKSLIAQAEKTHNIPKDLLLSIALVESRVNPYALSVKGKAIISKSTSDVKNKLQEYLRDGYSNIDIGVMQINYRWHREKFTNLDEMLDPAANIEYAARFLKQLYDTHGSWIQAVRHYHSATPGHHKRYSRKIIVTWLNS